MVKAVNQEQRLEHVEALARLMDSRFKIPGVPIPVGLDTIIGLIPGIGDTIGLSVSGYIMAHAHGLGAPKRLLLRMGGNVFVDWLIGLIPIVGDLFDWGWQANNRNTAMLRAHLERAGHIAPDLDLTARRKGP